METQNYSAKELAYNLEYLEDVIKDFKIEVSKDTINKNKVQDLLFKTKELLENLRILTKKYNDEMVWNILFSFLKLGQQTQIQKEEVILNIFKSATLKLPIEDIEGLITHISILLTLFTHAREELSNEYYLEKLYEIIPKIEGLLNNVKVSLKVEVGVLPKLGSLTYKVSSWNFGERWIVAIAYLQAFEIIINNLAKDLGIEIKDDKGFKDKFKAVIKELSSKREQIELVKLEEKIPEIFWDIRNKVVHGGYEPSKEELDTITFWTSQLIEKFRTLKSNESTSSKKEY
jgi:predicted secreted protein